MVGRYATINNNPLSKIHTANLAISNQILPSEINEHTKYVITQIDITKSVNTFFVVSTIVPKLCGKESASERRAKQTPKVFDFVMPSAAYFRIFLMQR